MVSVDVRLKNYMRLIFLSCAIAMQKVKISLSSTLSRKRKNCNICGNTYNDKNFVAHQVNCRRKHSKSATEDINHVVVDPVDPIPSLEPQEDSTDETCTDEENIAEVEVVHPDDYDELLQDLQSTILNESSFDFMQSEESSNRASLFSKLICLFIALWQCTFTITDSALESLLKFIKWLFVTLGKENHFIECIGQYIPGSIFLFKNSLGLNMTSFKEYVICIKCFKLYDYDQCVMKVQGRLESKKCTHVEFPLHTQRARRTPCNQQLLKMITTPDGKYSLHPSKRYCYKPIEESIIDVLKQDGNFEKCEEWRNNIVYEDVLTDIYDGKIWKEFNDPNKFDFFTKPNNFGLMLNLDWFGPFKHRRRFSIGVLYLVILNLPRSERFKRKNVIIVGIIPNMDHEPKVNTFVEPLVEELAVAWTNSFAIKICNEWKTIRLALLVVGCDIPACQKLCGFLGHSATIGCSRCKSEFPGPFGAKNFGGFNRESWEKRTHQEHCDQMERIWQCKTKTEKSKMESSFGTRYSCLTTLPYYDSIRMSAIDPMHNLYLGTAKHMVKLWLENDLLDHNAFEIMQRRVNSTVVPSDVGKMPNKLAEAFDAFNADEYKNWTQLFSILALNGLLPKEHLECWRYFVIACNYLSNRTISLTNLKIADEYLMKFCKKFEVLFGSNKVTPNMHLHGHLAECVIDIGPIYCFCLFSFERYNGLLGNYPTNNRNIESQIMKKFLRDSRVWHLKPEIELLNGIEIDMAEFCQGVSLRGTLKEIEKVQSLAYLKLASRLFCFNETDVWQDVSVVDYPRRPSIYVFAQNEYDSLCGFYAYIYGAEVNHFDLPVSCWKSSEIVISGEIFGSLSSRYTRSCYVLAYWPAKDGTILPPNEMPITPNPGRILYFIKYTVTKHGQSIIHVFAKIEWNIDMLGLKHHFGKPVEVWNKDLFYPDGPASFIPIQRIKSKFILAFTKVRGLDVMLVLPRDRNYNI